MARLASLLLLILSAASPSGAFAAGSRFAAVDACQNAGGAWNYRVKACEASDPGPVDFIRVDKSDHWMAAYRGGRIVREFRVAIGRGGLAPKQQRGDRLVPEGLYRITQHNPSSAYHRALRIGYPTPEQLVTARAAGFDPGTDIMIHGLPNGYGSVGSRQNAIDWTDGCIALTNPEIEWLFRTVPDGTPVLIDQ